MTPKTNNCRDGSTLSSTERGEAENPPAFPNHPAIQIDGSSPADWHGMTLRDWFAGQAMIAAHSRAAGQHLQTRDGDLAADAEIFYRMADAMLRARGGVS